MGKISHSDLQVVANGSDGFTGADLQALLCTAQINLSQSKLKIVYTYIDILSLYRVPCFLLVF